MPSTPFQTGNYYHLYNRGIEKREIFLDRQDYERFLKGLTVLNDNSNARTRDYLERKALQDEPTLDVRYRTSSVGSSSDLVEIIAYCFNPNHYHLLVKQLKDNGISTFMHKLSMGYTKYFNNKYKRSGHLWQGKFKSSHIKSMERLVWLSAYINGNPEIHGIAQSESWPYSSYQEYLGVGDRKLCDTDVIMKESKSVEEYKNFVSEVIGETKEERKELADDLLE